jgi:Phosphatidate phosphatase APP1, catalytic domain
VFVPIVSAGVRRARRGYSRGMRPPQPPAIHRAARVEDAVRGVLNRRLLARGWRPQVVPYAGYGTQNWVRLLGRVLITPPGSRRRDPTVRGWRRFLSAPAPDVPVLVEIAGEKHEVESGRDGYLDLVLPAALPPGRAQALLSIAGGPRVRAPLYVVDAGSGTGIVSDIDDTVMVTALPRPIVAFWNTFVRHEASRRPVPGMPLLYHALLDVNPAALVVYVSTGPWNVAPSLEQFLATHGYPPGPLLLSDWGPTTEAWFRSGREHKRTELRRLLGELSGLTWILIGDDGQHDPDLYAAAAEEFPGRVGAVLIRQLSPLEQVLTHGTPEPPDAADPPGPPDPGRSDAPEPPGGADLSSEWPPEIRAPDGVLLLAELRQRGLLPAAPGWP